MADSFDYKKFVEELKRQRSWDDWNNDSSPKWFDEIWGKGGMKDKEKSLRDAYDILEKLKANGGDTQILDESEIDKLKDVNIELDDIKDNMKAINNASNNLQKGIDNNSSSSRLKATKGIIGNMVQQIKSMKSDIDDIIGPWQRADHAASQYVKTLGATKAGMDALRSNTIDNVVKGRLGRNFNVSVDELIEAQQKYVQGVGRSLRISNEGQESLAAMRAVMNGRETELAVAFENFGVSLEGTAKHAGKMFDEASRSGLSFEKYSDNVAKNIKIAQNYTFKNGLKGLEGMAKKATALRLDMGQIASLADKIGSVEGSIDVASKLQVLGGPFASFADPLGMMSEGLLDVESLTDRIGKMIGGLGEFDKTTGEVRVSAFNKQRVKAAAQAMGVDYGTLMESVNAQAKRKEIEMQINSSANARGLDSDMQELLKNSATFNEEGKAGVSINGEFKTIDQLTNEDYEDLVKETQNESADIKDIAKNVRSLADIREGKNKQKDAVQAKMTSGLGHFMKGITKAFAWCNHLLGIIVAIEIAGSISNIISKGKSAFGRGGKFGKGAGNLFGKGGGVKGKFGKGAGNLFGKGGGVKGKFGKGAGNLFKKGGGKTIQAGERGLISKTTESLGRFGTKSIEQSAKLGETLSKSSSKILQKAGTAVTKNAEKQAVKYGVKSTSKKAAAAGAKGVAKRAVAKESTKIAAKTATKAGGKMLAGAAKGGVVGIVGAAGNIATDVLVEKGKIKKGGGVHTAAKVGFTALEGAGLGAAIGSVIPGIGTAIGAVVGAVGGAVVGAVKAAKVKREIALDNKLEKLGVERKGDYGARKLRKINEALDNGKISNSLRRRLEREGDTAILDEIDKKKKEKDEEREAKKDRRAERLGKIFGGGASKQNIAKATINVQRAIFAGKAFGTSDMEEGGSDETGSKNSKAKKLGAIGAIGMLIPGFQAISAGLLAAGSIEGIKSGVKDIKGKLETGYNEDALKMKQISETAAYEEAKKKYDAEKANGEQQNKTDIPTNIGGKIELNITGSIKLTGADGKDADITKELLDNKDFVKEITKLVNEQISTNLKGGYIPNSQYRPMYTT